MRILVTGGAGFIGSHLINNLILNSDHQVFNLDCLTYAANLDRLDLVQNNQRYAFFKANIADFTEVSAVLANFKPQAIINLAAETHVDRSIHNPAAFIHTNIVGTYSLLENTRFYFAKLSQKEQSEFRFLHISTDEVYGSLKPNDLQTAEDALLAPSSPYSASKASGDHLVRAWYKTYQIPTIISRSSNNYGEHQDYEKLIPHIIICALKGQNLPIYGNGLQIRDWIYVEDHVKALQAILEGGQVGEIYNVGASCEITNLDLVKQICDLLAEFAPNKPKNIDNYQQLISFVADRMGHDVRYGLNSNKINQELGFRAKTSLQEGLRKTVSWYVNHFEKFSSAN